MDLRQQLQESLGSAYVLERELGGGGMSRVFVAFHEELSRRVVVKVLAPELTASVSIERFQREITLAAQLQHPHVLPVHTSGVAGGLPYFTMPFVEGESLRARLEAVGALPVVDVVRITREVADALAYAHERGIVHRDIKPDNILLNGGHAFVTDFGVAKALADAQHSAVNLTATGVVVGTPAYMSPEQLSGDAIDARTDYYSLGATVYEMLVGKPPFAGRSARATLAAHVVERPKPVSESRPDTPPILAELVMACLEKDPADRPQTRAKFFAALDSIDSSGAMPSRNRGEWAPSLTLREALRALQLGRVAAGYLASFVAVVASAVGATRWLGLPEWVPRGAAAVMLLGLPVLVLTALAELIGARTRVAKPAREFAAPEGNRSGTYRIAMPARRRLSWRRAVGGGIAALIIFALGVSSYMVLRVLGIGPAGSLIGAGVVGTRERLLVADFRGPGSDSLLGSVVTEALRTDIAQSRSVSLVEPAHVRGALVRMERPGSRTLDHALALEIAAREGIRVVLDGEVAPIGRGYVFSARLISTETGQPLAGFRTTASDEGEFIPAIDRLSKQLRAKIGESLRSVQRSAPLDRVTTPSLAALRRYTAGVRAIEISGDVNRGIALLEEAIALDTTFAMAYRRLGLALGGRGEQRARAYAMLKRAYFFRDRLTDVERYLAIGSYYSSSGRYDPTQAIEAYEALLQVAPDNGAALNNLGQAYMERREYRRATEYFSRGIASDSSTSPIAFSNLITAYVALGETAKAERVLERMTGWFPRNPEIMFLRSAMASARGDYAAAEKPLLSLRAADPSSMRIRVATGYRLLVLAEARGRLGDARRLLRDLAAAEEERGFMSRQLTDEVSLAWLDILFLGRVNGGIRSIDSALVRHPLARIQAMERPYVELATIFARAGRPDRARALLDEYRTVVDSNQRQATEPELHLALGELALSQGRADDAIAEFRLGDRGYCRVCALSPLGRAFTQARMADSAIAYYERYRTTSWIYHAWNASTNLAFTLRELAQLYAARGEARQAQATYDAWRALWRDGDSELRPILEAGRPPT